MPNPETDRFSPPCWTQSRRDLVAWLQETAPSLAELYEGAVNLIFVTPLPGRTRFVAHAIREIRNRLPDYVSPAGTAGIASKRIDATRIDSLSECWSKDGLPLDGSLPVAVAGGPSGHAQGVTVSERLYRNVSEIIRDHLAGREKHLDSAVRLFRAIAPENQILGDALRPIAVQFHRRAEWFVGRAHEPGAGCSAPTDDELQVRFEEFEESLISVAGKIVPVLEQVRAIVEDANR